MVREAEDVGVPELFARHQIWRTLDDDSDFFRQFPFWFLLAAYFWPSVQSGFHNRLKLS